MFKIGTTSEEIFYALPVVLPSMGFSVTVCSSTERNQIAKSQSGYMRDFSILRRLFLSVKLLGTFDSINELVRSYLFNK